MDSEKDAALQPAEEDVQREYGVEEAVPKKARHIGFVDMMLSWGGANMQPPRG